MGLSIHGEQLVCPQLCTWDLQGCYTRAQGPRQIALKGCKVQKWPQRGAVTHKYPPAEGTAGSEPPHCLLPRTSPHFSVCLVSELVFFQNRTTTSQKELGSPGARLFHMPKADLLTAPSLHGTRSSVVTTSSAKDYQLSQWLPALLAITSSLGGYQILVITSSFSDYQLSWWQPDLGHYQLSVISGVLLHPNLSFPAAPLYTCQSIHPWACCSPK